MFDLGLPRSAQSVTLSDNWNVGVELLEEMATLQRNSTLLPFARSIVVSSVHFRAEALQRLIATQIVSEFIDKSTESSNAMLCMAVARAYREGQAREWERRKQLRIVRWLSHVSQEQCGRLARVVTNGVSDALHKMRALEQLVEDTTGYSVERDFGQDELCNRARQTRLAIDSIKTSFAVERDRTSISLGSEAAKINNDFDLILRQSIDNVQQGLESRRLQISAPSESGAIVAVSPAHLQLVLEEFLFGTVDCAEPNPAIEESNESKEKEKKDIDLTVRPNAEDSTLVVSIGAKMASDRKL